MLKQASPSEPPWVADLDNRWLASSAFGWKTGLRRANETELATLEYAFTGVASLRCSAAVSEAARERPLDSAERASGFGAGAGAG
ncbi:hypothetical protein CIT31_01275 [Mesorhizobium wenxiniae]|uniref:Uncharacterized protein n=1 Tax=Mesorhizobium wenxiniae TaxID=2014805 RepID=A0A271KR62_9HYPH|nr:hypothetical protein CIT31_01275 [Mesorhizobium wenxiniae]